MSTGLILGLGLAAVAAVMAVWHFSRKAEQEIRSALDGEITSKVAKWLAQRSHWSEKEAYQYLSNSDVPAEFSKTFDESVDFVVMVFSHSQGKYRFEVTVEKDGEAVFTTERAIRLDDLPDPVQDKFLHGENHVTIPWHPGFRNVTAA